MNIYAFLRSMEDDLKANRQFGFGFKVARKLQEVEIFIVKDILKLIQF